MRDITLLRFTLRAMRDLREGGARMHRDGRHQHNWFAGQQPLNTQAVQDLIDDGWLRRDANRVEVRIDAWPPFARHPGGRDTHV